MQVKCSDSKLIAWFTLHSNRETITRALLLVHIYPKAGYLTSIQRLATL